MFNLPVKIAVILCILFSYTKSYSQLTLEDIFLTEKYAAKNPGQISFLQYKPLFAKLSSTQKDQQITFYNGQNLKVDVWNISVNNNEYADNASGWSGLTFSPKDNYFLVSKQCERPYRNSAMCSYYFGKSNGIAEPLSSGKQYFPEFSPDEKFIAFVKYNNLFYKNIETNTEKQITTDGSWNKVINAKSDWVYEEEFGLTKAFVWNAQSTKIAFLKFDETDVKEYAVPVNYDAQYPNFYTYKYPKVGEQNAKVSLWYYDLKSGKNKQVKLPYSYEYIPAIYWNASGDEIVVALMNRFQDTLRLVAHHVKSGKSREIYFETDKAYLMVPNVVHFLSDNSIFISSEKDGYNHIYHYDKNGKLIQQITKGAFEVKELYGVDEKNQQIYLRSNEGNETETIISAVHYSTTEGVKLSRQAGSNKAKFSSDFSYNLNTYSSVTQPPQYSLESTVNDNSIVLEDNKLLKEKLSTIPTKEFIRIPSDSVLLNAWIIKPVIDDTTKRYPLLMYLYGGPGDQEVLNEWGNASSLFFSFLAQNGIAVACTDNRGTDGRGSVFRKASYLNLGKIETKDQVSAARYLGNLPHIDSTRITIYGWSYGGFMAAVCLQEAGDVFKSAIAAAPVTNWNLYDNIYTERYMKTPFLNPSGYANYNPISGVKKLKGNLMLIHGTADDNVHFQHTLHYINALNEAQKDYNLYLYPNSAHGISGKQNRLDVYSKMYKFLQETFK